MKRISLLAACVAALTAVPCLADSDKPSDPKVQIAILIDTSSSMDGLINQTREQLWRIVNTFATAKRDGKRAKLELALYEYGNDNLPSGNDFVRRVVPLTTDLDRVSEALFGLKTNGGEEYCGAVIAHAMKELEWSSRPGDLKLIYIAGNEPFTQGPVPFQKSVKAAIERGIVVNTIHAGTEQEGINGQWMAAARLADGNFLFIDQNRTVARVDAPQDAQLAALSAKLNQTYIAYGAAGKAAVARQEAQDKNAQAMSASAASTRAAAKASAMYDNAGWDLVDAKKKGESIATMPAAALPPEMQKMDPKEREAFVEQKAKERAEIQAQIAKLSKERDEYVQAELKKRARDATKTMDDALLESAKAQAEKMDYSF
ncbi:MAG: vWA domain-containing protein [Myxococcota bacterium]